MAEKRLAQVSRAGETVLTILGGVFGIIGGLMAVIIGGAQTALEDQSMNVGVLGWAAIGFSALALVALFFISSRTKLAGWLILLSAVGGLVSISFFYVLPFILLLIAGLMCLLRGRKAVPSK